jgi:hypothetical protein
MGIVLGWLLGSLYGRVHDPPRTVLAVSVAALLTIADISYLAGPSAIIVLIPAIVLPFIIHLLWRHHLYRRCGLANARH